MASTKLKQGAASLVSWERRAIPSDYSVGRSQFSRLWLDLGQDQRPAEPYTLSPRIDSLSENDPHAGSSTQA